MKNRERPESSESPTRQFILKAAKTLFRQEDFSKVSVEDICRKAGASKMSFYRHFRNKIHLALIIVEEFVTGEYSWFEQLLQAEVGFIEKMNLVYRRRLDSTKKLGPLLLEETNFFKDTHQKMSMNQLFL
jgi:AcrR family transcriptional regulator